VEGGKLKPCRYESSSHSTKSNITFTTALPSPKKGGGRGARKSPKGREAFSRAGSSREGGKSADPMGNHFPSRRKAKKNRRNDKSSDPNTGICFRGDSTSIFYGGK